MKQNVAEEMTDIDKIIKEVEDDKKKIPNAVEITRLALINEPIKTLYKKNTNHITNSNKSLINKITHPIRFRFIFNGIRYNLHEMRIIKSEKLVSLGDPFDLEIHLIHRDDNNINNTLTVVFPILEADTENSTGLLEDLLISTADIPEDNKFYTYNGRIHTIDYNCFNEYLQGTEICFYAPIDNKIYLITQKPIYCQKKYIKKIKHVLK